MSNSDEYVGFVEPVDTEAVHRHGLAAWWQRQIVPDRPQQLVSARGIHLAEVHLGAKHSSKSINILVGCSSNDSYSHHERSLLNRDHCVVSAMALSPSSLKLYPRQYLDRGILRHGFSDEAATVCGSFWRRPQPFVCTKYVPGQATR
jgi:hypothetical protein